VPFPLYTKDTSEAVGYPAPCVCIRVFLDNRCNYKVRAKGWYDIQQRDCTLLGINNKFYQVGHCLNAFPPEYYLLRGWKYPFSLQGIAEAGYDFKFKFCRF